MGNKHSNANKCQCPKNARKHKHQCSEKQHAKQQHFQQQQQQQQQQHHHHHSTSAPQQEKQHLQQKLHSPYHTNVVHCGGPGHASQTSSWLPPLENWEAGGDALPYGWEAATDKEGKPYFINAVRISSVAPVTPYLNFSGGGGGEGEMGGRGMDHGKGEVEKRKEEEGEEKREAGGGGRGEVEKGKGQGQG
ncbi:protein kibra-like [Macrobrachium nipponense]|uniref:protein kibra-like n=1 Tax=Macrobrachium nipponense TaxID=159736 RepID=UPI0030C82155